MGDLLSFGGLIPLWILGAGLVAGVIGLSSAPKPVHRADNANAYPNAGRAEPMRRPA